jgi:hypothetical protein
MLTIATVISFVLLGALIAKRCRAHERETGLPAPSRNTTAQIFRDARQRGIPERQAYGDWVARSSDECRPLTIGGVRVPPQGWGADKDGTVPAADALAGSPARGSSRPCPPRSSAVARIFDPSLNVGDEQSDVVQGHLVESRANPSLVQIDHVVDQVIICHREPPAAESALCSAERVSLN